jgi:hypothetical protein
MRASHAAKEFPRMLLQRICKQSGKDVRFSGLKKTFSPRVVLSSIDFAALLNFTSCSIIIIIRDICYLLL